jgi:hypothetical protein
MIMSGVMDYMAYRDYAPCVVKGGVKVSRSAQRATAVSSMTVWSEIEESLRA